MQGPLGTRWARVAWACSVVLWALAGCAPGRTANDNGNGNTGGDSFPVGSFGAACQGASTVVSGIVRAPNGVDPVALANVYVVQAVTPIPPGVACEICGKPFDSALAETTANASGLFSLNLDMLPQAASLKLVVNKGRFRRVVDLAVTSCQTFAAPAADLVLPGRSADGDIPKIAVATGATDHLDVVLDSLGITEFDCYVGTRPGSTNTAQTPCATATVDVATLLTDAAKLATYNMLFLSCAPGKYASLAAPQTITTNLKAWVAAGGRLFSTDESYDYVEQTFPDYIDFFPGSTTPSTAQPVDQANLGVGASLSSGGATYSATVQDGDLAAWLQGVNAVPPEANTLTLNGFLNPWAAQKSVTTDVKTEVTASAAYYTTTATAIGSPSATTMMPMTVQWDYQMCGRVLFSSYHTLATTQQGTTLSPQEKILEYLMLDLSSCVGPIG